MVFLLAATAHNRGGRESIRYPGGTTAPSMLYRHPRVSVGHVAAVYDRGQAPAGRSCLLRHHDAASPARSYSVDRPQGGASEPQARDCGRPAPLAGDRLPASREAFAGTVTARL